MRMFGTPLTPPKSSAAVRGGELEGRVALVEHTESRIQRVAPQLDGVPHLSKAKSHMERVYALSLSVKTTEGSSGLHLMVKRRGIVGAFGWDVA